MNIGSSRTETRYFFVTGKVSMIHHSCDCCKRALEADDLRYVVKMEVYAAFDPAATDELDDDRDHLQEIQEILQHSPVLFCIVNVKTALSGILVFDNLPHGKTGGLVYMKEDQCMIHILPLLVNS